MTITALSSGQNPISRRRDYLLREVRAFITKTGGPHREPALVVHAIPQFLDRSRKRVRYYARVDGQLLSDDWFEELRDIINRARSLLDNAMWAAAKGNEPGKYSNTEKDKIKFKIAVNEPDWRLFCVSKHGQELGQPALDALRAIQPFVTGDPVAPMFNKVNNVDKHRDPLELAVLVDPLMPLVLGRGIASVPGEDGHGFVWQPRTPLTGNQRLLDYTSDKPLPDLEAHVATVALCVDVDGDWIDLQDFLQDIVVFTVNAFAILAGEDTSWADEHRQRFDAERRRLANLRKALRDGDQIADALWQAGY